MQVLVISKDQDEREILSYLIRRSGFAVASSSSLDRALQNWPDHPADLTVLSLVEDSGASNAAKNIRKVTQALLLILVEPITERLTCRLLQEGADMVLGRPVSPLLFESHIQALARRASTVPSFILPTLQLEELALDPSTRLAIIAGREPIHLTRLEFRLLYTLMTHRGQVVPVDMIVERVWGYSGEGNRELVRGLVSRLRSKLEPAPGKVRFIETISGVGYRFIRSQ